MEMEFFVAPGTDENGTEYWIDAQWYIDAGEAGEPAAPL